MTMLALSGFDHYPKNTVDWLTYKPNYINIWTSAANTIQISTDGWLFSKAAPSASDFLQFDTSKVHDGTAKKVWFSWKMKILSLSGNLGLQNLILLDTVADPDITPSRPVQWLSTGAILPTRNLNDVYQIDVMIDRENFQYDIRIDGELVTSGSIISTVRPRITAGTFFILPTLRRLTSDNGGSQIGIKQPLVYNDVDNGDGITDYLGLLDLKLATVVSAEAQGSDWEPIVQGDTLLQGITKPIETASTGVRTLANTPLDVGISVSVPSDKRIRGVGFITSSKTSSGGTPLQLDFGGNDGAPIAQKTALTHGQRSTIFTTDSNGLAWTEASIAAARLNITAG